MSPTIYQGLLQGAQKGKKRFSVLIDPDKLNLSHLAKVIELSTTVHIDFFLVGGSLLMHDELDDTLHYIKQHSDTPVILFPGNSSQINERADAILLLSMISGRNPDLLIGQHVTAAPYLKRSQLEVISTGYMLIDGGTESSVSYMSNTQPIPANKSDIAACTAMAGELLGHKVIYMDAGSGAHKAVSMDMIKTVKQYIDIPIIVGGGIRSAESAYNSARAGADMVVIGNAIEKDPMLIAEISSAVHAAESTGSEAKSSK